MHKMFYAQKTEISENQIRFLISAKIFEWFGFKATLFFTDFSDFSIFCGQLASPVQSNFLKITAVSRKRRFRTKFAITGQYMEENMVNYLKNCQKTVVFWRILTIFVYDRFFGVMTSQIKIFLVKFDMVVFRNPWGF